MLPQSNKELLQNVGERLLQIDAIIGLSFGCNSSQRLKACLSFWIPAPEGRTVLHILVPIAHVCNPFQFFCPCSGSSHFCSFTYVLSLDNVTNYYVKESRSAINKFWMKNVTRTSLRVTRTCLFSPGCFVVYQFGMRNNVT